MKTYTYDAIVIGSGAAGYNAAIRLSEFGINACIVTENVMFGTSRNTGSDKQTYYKLGLGGSSPDSVYTMASNLFDGGCVDGDNALCEAALSTRCFMNLCELGVEFPVNRYGEYVGYKTDHDPYARATSAGPLTSKFMTQVLEEKAKKLQIPVFDGYLAIEILKNEDYVCGLLCLKKDDGEYVAFKANDIIIATGGPGGIYNDSVYPSCHTGTTSLALLVGAKLQNLTEWQYGLASVAPRWNVSGTYMQVLPRFVSVDETGAEYEFLSEYFSDTYEMLSMIFLKGYQWPFDSKKVLEGSSVIDLLVFRECAIKNRKVYLDFTKNPAELKDIDYKKLSSEAYDYLSKADACFGSPIDRLKKMNTPAIELYSSKGVDITKEYLQIALCAQHNNGGIAVNMWWETNIRGLFAAGECAGTHGITRPGGSALNAGQVGSLRAAQYISQNPNKNTPDDRFVQILNNALYRHHKLTENILTNNNVEALIKNAQIRMSEKGSAVRNTEAINSAIVSTKKEIENLSSVGTGIKNKIYRFYKLKDILYTQLALLAAIENYSEVNNDTRGSAIYQNKNGQKRDGLEEIFRFIPENEENRKKIQELYYDCGEIKFNWRSVRPIPENDDFFENVWNVYRKNKNIY